jgi:hypothetical protein
MARFVLEGEWSGYVSSQQRVVHRETITARRAKTFVLSAIQYTDGTTLRITVRPAQPREKIEERRSYSALIREAEATGKPFVRVADLSDDEEAA